jgi:hypothetical protein
MRGPGRSKGPHSFLAERGSERPGGVKGAFLAAKRTLGRRGPLWDDSAERNGPMIRLHHRSAVTQYKPEYPVCDLFGELV